MVLVELTRRETGKSVGVIRFEEGAEVDVTGVSDAYRKQVGDLFSQGEHRPHMSAVGPTAPPPAAPLTSAWFWAIVSQDLTSLGFSFEEKEESA
jgi:hypothetical protein